MKKLLAILMAVILALGMTPGVSASATGTEQSTEFQQETQVGDSPIASPTTGKTITGMAASLGNPAGVAKDIIEYRRYVRRYLRFHRVFLEWNGDVLQLRKL